MTPPCVPSRAQFLRLAGLGGLFGVGLAAAGAAVPSLVPAALASSKPPKHTWVNVFSDDFNGPALDPRWVVFSGNSTTNAGVYNPAHVSVAGGNLVVYGEQDQVGGVALYGPGAPQLQFMQVVFTQRTVKVGLDDVTPTFADVSLVWPAHNDRAESPELDIRETSQIALKPVQQTFHFSHNHEGSLTQNTAVDGGAWHKYTVEIAPDGVTYRVDGKVTLASADPGVIPAGPMWFGCQVERSWKAAPTALSPAGCQWIQQTKKVDVNAFVK